MGQTWSIVKHAFLEESESEEESESLTQLRESQATTEDSSSVAAFDNRGVCSTCPLDFQLSNLQSIEATVDTRRGTAPTLSTSHFSSVKGSLTDSEAPCALRTRKLALELKVEAYREALHGQFAIRKLGACAGAEHQQIPDGAKWTENDAGEDEMLHSFQQLESHAMVGRKRKLMQCTSVSQPPLSPAQTLSRFQLDPKRKRSAGIPSLAFDDAGLPATHMKPNAPSPLERPSEGVVTGKAVLDLGTGDSMVGRSVRKLIEGETQSRRGHVAGYDPAQRLYQIKYDDAKEEALEWLDLEPCLIGGRTRSSKPRYKTVDELVYTKQQRPGSTQRRRR